MSQKDESGDEARTGTEDSTSEPEAAEAPETLETTEAEEATERASAAPREPRRAKGPRKSASSGKARERQAKASPQPSSIRSSSAALFVVVALAAGGAAGWFGHIAQAKAMVRADSAPATAGSAASSGGPCGAWKKQICAGGTAEAAACQQATAATELLTPSTCEAALEAMPATLAKIKAGRVPCDTLVGKLCTDLPPGSATCQMVKERTPSFPSERCREMLGTYDTVLAEVKMLDEQMGQMGNAPHGMPPGAMPPGAMPPGAMPAHP